jgi:hypothetical protein
MSEREIFGDAECLHCGGPVTLKINVNRKVYYHCGTYVADPERANGRRYVPGCSMRATFGAVDSRQMIAERARALRERKRHGKAQGQLPGRRVAEPGTGTVADGRDASGPAAVSVADPGGDGGGVSIVPAVAPIASPGPVDVDRAGTGAGTEKRGRAFGLGFFPGK